MDALQMLQHGAACAAFWKKWRRGLIVRITDGPLCGSTGYVQGGNAGNATLQVWMLDHGMLTFHISQLEPEPGQQTGGGVDQMGEDIPEQQS